MDDFPELKTDADVDALMGRLRARLAPAPATPVRTRATDTVPAAPIAVPSTAAFGEVLAAQDRLAATLGRALAALTEALDELHAGDDVPVDPPPVRVAARRRRPVPAGARRSAGRGGRRA